MTVLQTISLASDTIKVRWKQPYMTEGINQKSLGSTGAVKGVQAGFNVVPSAGFVVSIAVDATLGLSIANVLETTGGTYSLTVVQSTAIAVDLTAQANTTVYIALDAQYAISTTTAAQIKVVDAAELATNLDLVLLARVAVPLAAPVVTANINSAYRTISGDFVPAEAKPYFNLVANGTFERDTAPTAPFGWTASNVTLTLSTINSIAKTGSNSMVLTAGGAVTEYALSGPMPVQAGDVLRARAWMRSVGGTPISGGTGVQLQVQWFNAAGASISVTDVDSTFTGAGTTFVERKAAVTAPTNAYIAKLRVSYGNCSGVLYVDDAELSTPNATRVAEAAVFGGPLVNADQFHTHSAGGAYSGSGPWADASTLPASTIEAAIDNVVAAIGGATGAAKMGFTAVTPIDLTTARVDLAINELDDKKAGIGIANVFTRNNTINNTIADTTALTAVGNGTGAGVDGTGGATAGSVGVTGTGGSGGGIGVRGTGTGAAGAGGYFQGSATASGGTAALSGVSTNTNGVGVAGTGTGTGAGVAGTGASTGAGVTGRGAGATVGATAGEGVYGFGGATSSGVRGTSGGTGSAVRGDGNFAGNTGIGAEGFGGGTSAGVKGTGGSTAPASNVTLEYGAGVVGVGGSGGSSGVYGVSGFGINVGSTSLTPRAGVIGIGSGTFGVGVFGISSADSSSGSFGGSFTGADGFDTNGVAGSGKQAGHGGVFTGGPTGNAIRIGTGHAAFTGANPAASVAFTNTAAPTSILKAWARVHWNAGAGSIVSGFNVSGVSAVNLTLGIFSITLAAGVTLATRVVASQQQFAVGMQYVDTAGSPSATVVTVKAVSSSGVDIDLNSGLNTFAVFVYGPQ